MGTHVFGRSAAPARVGHGLSQHWAWLAGGLALGFAVPFVLADVLDLNRDLFYGVYALAVAGLFVLWSRSTGYDLVAACRRRWPLAPPPARRPGSRPAPPLRRHSACTRPTRPATLKKQT